MLATPERALQSAARMDSGSVPLRSGRLLPDTLAADPAWLKDNRIRARVPGGNQRKGGFKYGKRRNRTEAVFDRFEDRRRLTTRYDRCPKVFMSVIARVAPVSHQP